MLEPLTRVSDALPDLVVAALILVFFLMAIVVVRVLFGRLTNVFQGLEGAVYFRSIVGALSHSVSRGLLLIGIFFRSAVYLGYKSARS